MGLTTYRKGGVIVRASSDREATRKFQEVARAGRKQPRSYTPSSGSSSSSARYRVVGSDGKIYPATSLESAKAFAKTLSGGSAVIDSRSSQSSINKTLSLLSKSLVKTQQQLSSATAQQRLTQAQLLNQRANEIYNQTGGNLRNQQFRNIINQINRLGFQPSVINIKKTTQALKQSQAQQRLRLAEIRPDVFKKESLKSPQIPQFKDQPQQLRKDQTLLTQQGTFIGLSPKDKSRSIKPSEIKNFITEDKRSPFAKKLEKKGLVVPANIILGVKDAFGKDWKNLITNFTVGFGSDLALRSIGSKVLTKAVGVVAIPLVLYDLGKSYRIMKGRGYNDTYALTRALVSLGVAGAGVGASRVSGVKVKVPKSKFRNIEALFRKTKLGKNILKALNTKKSNIFLFDKQGIVRVNGKSKTFKYQIEGNSYKNNFFTKPTKTYRFALKDAEGVTRYVDSKTLKSFRKSLGKRTFEEGFKLNKELGIKLAKRLKAKENVKLAIERRALRRQLKYSTRTPPSLRQASTSKGYKFEDLKTGKIRYFTSRNKWIRAVKQQEKLIRAGKIKQPKPKPTGKFVTRSGQTIEILAKKQKILKSNNWRIPRILRVVDGEPIFKYQNVDYKTYSKWAKAIRSQNKGKWKQGTLKNWDKIIKDSEKHFNLLKQLEKAKKPKKVNVLANRFKQAVKTNVKQQEKLLKGEIKGNGQRQQLLLKTKQIVKTEQIPKIKQIQAQRQQLLTRQLTKKVQVRKGKTKPVLIARQKQKQKVKTQQVQAQKQAFKQVQKTKTIQSIATIQALQQAYKVNFISVSALKVNQINVSKAISRLTQILNQNLAKVNLSRLTTTKLKSVIPQQLKRKKRTKKQEEEIRKWLKRQPKVYRPSLSAILFDITGYAPPKSITGLEIRPILIKRRKQK